MRFIEMFAVEKPARSPMKNFRTEEAPDRIIYSVAHDGSDKKAQQQNPDVQRAARGDGAQGKEKGISRQEGSDHQARFAKDNQEKDHIGPGTQLHDQVVEVFVQVQNNIEQLLHNQVPALARLIAKMLPWASE